MDLKFFNPPQGQWLKFGKKDGADPFENTTFDRYHERAIKALDYVFSSQKFTPEQAKDYLNKILAFAQKYPSEFHSDWYAPSVDEKFLEERAQVVTDDTYLIPLRDVLSRNNGLGLAYVAKVGLHLLKNINGGIEAKVVKNPTGIACECPD